MNGEPLRIEVAAAVHNRKQLTLQCLRSISRFRDDGMTVHSVIVDDGSTDGTADAIRSKFPDVEIVTGSGDLWYTEGTNTAIRAALSHDPDYVLLINDDQVFDADSLSFMVETARRHPRSVVGPLLLLWDTPHRLFQVSPVWNTLIGGWRHWHRQTVWTIPKRPWKVDIIVGNCVLVPAAAFREEGLMNSKRYPNFGDAEFTPRLKRKGWRLIIDPRARVFCQPNAIPPRVRKMGWRKLFNTLFLDLGNPHNLRRRFYANWDGAPSRLLGVIGYFFFLGRAALGVNYEAEPAPEPPLAETFAEAVLDD